MKNIYKLLPCQRMASHRLGVLLLGLPLSIVVALRGQTGDTINYLNAFVGTVKFPWDPFAYYAEYQMEWLFGLLSWVINSVGLPPSILFFLFSFGTFYGLSLASMRMNLSLFAIAPYYLSTFFLTQQFLQIRQGLAMALVFAILPPLVCRRGKLAPFLYLGLAYVVHMASCLTVLSTWFLKYITIVSPSRFKISMGCFLLIIIAFIGARFVMSLDLVSTMERVAVYAADDQYSSERAFFSAPNVRASILMGIMMLGVNARLCGSRVFVVLLGLYSLHLGMRFGFYDFLILSGRMATALSFAEVFILPILVKEHIRSMILRVLIGIIYFITHVLATYQIQTPTLIDDYLTPL